MAWLFVVILFRSSIYTGIASFLPLFCIRSLGTSAAVGSLTLSILSLSGIFATLAGGWLTGTDIAGFCVWDMSWSYRCWP